MQAFGANEPRTRQSFGGVAVDSNVNVKLNMYLEVSLGRQMTFLLASLPSTCGLDVPPHLVSSFFSLFRNFPAQPPTADVTLDRFMDLGSRRHKRESTPSRNLPLPGPYPSPAHLPSRSAHPSHPLSRPLPPSAYPQC